MNPTRLMKFAIALFLLITIAAGGAATYLGFESRINKTPRVNLDVSRISIPSSETKSQLTDFADNFSWIAGVNVIKVDFRNNTRATIFRYYKDEPLDTAWKEYVATKKGAPLFSSNEASNQRLIELVNGQFVCVKTTDTVASQLIPTINDYSQSTCMVPIPPRYGDFVGFINIFIRTTPTAQQVFSLEQLGTVISQDIYKRDVERY